MKNIRSKMKSTLDGINRLDTAEKKISELEKPSNRPFIMILRGKKY